MHFQPNFFGLDEEVSDALDVLALRVACLAHSADVRVSIGKTLQYASRIHGGLPNDGSPAMTNEGINVLLYTETVRVNTKPTMAVEATVPEVSRPRSSASISRSIIRWEVSPILLKLSGQNTAPSDHGNANDGQVSQHDEIRPISGSDQRSSSPLAGTTSPTSSPAHLASESEERPSRPAIIAHREICIYISTPRKV